MRLRDALATVPAYVPGQPPPQPEGLIPYKLSSNENPYPPLPGVLRAIEKAAGEVHRYPDASNRALIEAIAASLALPPDMIAVGPGSSGVLTQLVTALAGAGDEIVFAWRSFEMYPIMAGLAGATGVRVPLDADGRHQLDAMRAAITDRTRMLVLCTPNNPTGPAIHAGELTAFLDAVPASLPVIVDEAYAEFNRDPQAPDMLALLARYPNIVLCRTFSKAYGLAGLRVGYAIAHPVLAEAVRRTCAPFSVSIVAQAAAIASLAAADELTERVAALVAERERVIAALGAQGWQLPQTQANFVWFPLGERTGEFVRACEAQALAVRPFAGEGVRVTIGEVEANDRLIALAGRLAPTTTG